MTWPATPLVWAALLLALAALAADATAGRMGAAQLATATALLAGSAAPLAEGLGVELPLASLLHTLGVGASPYGLFAVITGVGGRPVALIEAATSAEGPWRAVPLLYQVSDPGAPLPLCWPHFPRLDWTLWFVPLGESGRWVGRLLRGILSGDPHILSLLDERAFHLVFPTPPTHVRLSEQLYVLDAAGGWQTVQPDEGARLVKAATDPDVVAAVTAATEAAPWPSMPLRALSDSLRPDQFVWLCFATAAVAARAVPPGESGGYLGMGVPEALDRLRGTE